MPSPLESLSPDRRLLVVAPAMLGTRRLTDRYLVGGLERGATCVLVTTDTAADRATERLAAATETDDAISRLGVVDATGQSPDSAADDNVESVGSPADLTGIGIAFQRLFERLGAGTGTPRVVVDSLSTLIVYSDVERVYRFTNTLTNLLDQVDAGGRFLMQPDAGSNHVDQLEALFEGRIDVRDHDGEGPPEYRLMGIGDDRDWHPLEVPKAPVAGPSAADERFRSTGSLPVNTPIESLHALIEAMDEAGYTLVVCNYTGDEATLGTLREHFARLNVGVRTATLSTPHPTDAAILHRDAEPLAVSAVQDLVSYIQLSDLDDIDPAALDITRPDVLAQAERQQYTVENGGKLAMIRISRLVETRALEAGSGRLHAGFQRLDRVDDEQGTRQLYERLATAGVDVHVYGTPGAIPNEELYTVHADAGEELAASWFVVYVPDAAGGRAGALVSEETGPDQYSGFWTFQPALVDATDEYLRRTYPADA
ncbi:MAG: DICT sensory domain-containing protein [Halosegnis sp.]